MLRNESSSHRYFRYYRKCAENLQGVAEYLQALLPCIRQLRRSTSDSQNLAVLPKRHDNSLSLRN